MHEVGESVKYQECGCAECAKDRMIMDAFAGGAPYVVVDNGPDGPEVVHPGDPRYVHGPNPRKIMLSVVACGVVTGLILATLWHFFVK